MQKFYSAFVVCLLCTLCGTVFAQSEENSRNLVAVGGGGAGDEIWNRLLELSPKENPVVLIIPHASVEENRQDRGRELSAFFRDMGIQQILVLDLENHAQALKAIEQADVIWMPGGGQQRLMRALEGADVAGALREKILSGIPAGGTSAGAAIMSDVMIANSNRDEQTGELVPVMSYGLAFWPEVIVDQHFSERNRLERLVTAVEKNPTLIGVGIDERTAAVVLDNGFEVIGEGTVTIVRVTDPGADVLVTETAILQPGDNYSFSDR